MSKASVLLVVVLDAILALSLGCARRPSDAAISSDIQNRFSQDSGLSAKQLTVEISDGVVTLAGMVDNDAQRQAAARQAGSVAGEKEVINNLQVSSVSKASRSAAATGKKAPLTLAQAVAGSKKSRSSKASEERGAYNEAKDALVADNTEPSPSVPKDERQTPPPPQPQPQKVTVEQGAQISVRLIDSIDSEKNQVGDTFHASRTLRSSLKETKPSRPAPILADTLSTSKAPVSSRAIR